MNWFVNLKVLYKILSLVTVLLLITALISFVGYRAAFTINEKSDAQAVSTVEINLAYELYIAALFINTTTDDLFADQSKKNIEKNEAILASAKATFEKNMKILEETADNGQKMLLSELRKHYINYLPAVENVFKMAASMPANPAEDELKPLNEAMQQSEKPMGELKDIIKRYVDSSVRKNQEDTDAATKAYELASKELMIASILALIIGLLMGTLIAVKGIARPLGVAVSNLNSLIMDDLTIEVKNTQRHDEVGDVAKAAQTFKEVLIKNKAMAEAEKIEVEKKLIRQQKVAELIANFDGTATQTVATVASASTQLSQTAENMSVVAGNTNQQSIEVASASEQASHNVQSVASAAEEMAATVQEISRQISMSNDIVRQAMQKAEDADNSSRELVDMSKSVGTIATLIEDIAGQINLLALNATIESARSGEAGKGFAVVANEVKNLATQTAKATEQIRQQLDAVQKTAVGVADMLGGVRISIGEVSQSSAAIAAAVEEQSAATHEIVSNMNTATQGVEQINNGIFAIKGGTDSTTAATREVLDAAKLLSVQAEKMDAEVKSFLSNIQAA